MLQDASRLGRITSQGLTADDFIVCGAEFKFIRDYLDQYKVVPTDGLVREVFSDWNPLEGEPEYWMSLMRRYTYARKAQTAIQRAMQGIQAGQVESATDRLVEELTGVRLSGSHNIIAADAGIPLRLERYRERVEKFNDSGGTYINGIPTTFSEINKTNQGWAGGELLGIYSRPTVGKTWKLCDELACAWMQGYRILFISPEMPAATIALRIDVLIGHRLGLRLSHKMIASGHPNMMDEYTRLSAEVSKHERLWVVDSAESGDAPGLMDIKSLAAQFHPDIIAVDGVMLLKNESKAQAVFQQMQYNIYGLKNFGTSRGIPIMVTHQSINTDKGSKVNDNEATGRGDSWRMPTLNDAADGEAFVRACTTIVTMAADKHRSGIRWYSVRKSRERELGFALRSAMLWNVDAGRIIDIGHLGQDENLINAEVKRLG